MLQRFQRPVDALNDHTLFDVQTLAQMRARLDKLFGTDHGHADLTPALQRVVQAAVAARWRYLPAEMAALLPACWRTE